MPRSPQSLALASRAVIISATIGAYAPRLVVPAASLLRRRDVERQWRSIGDVAVVCLWRLGPAFVKLGQLLSTRHDVLPPALCEALQRGLASGATGPGRSDGECWGSIAVVRRTVVGDTAVAVKVYHPDALPRLDRDLRLLEALAWGVERASRGVIPLRAVAFELTSAVRGQCDVVREAEALRAFERLERRQPVVFPRVLDVCPQSGVLTMTWLDGQHIRPAKFDPHQTAKRLLCTVFEMLFVQGLVHCDLHPGNWWVLPDGQLAIVDAGFTYELEPDMVEHFAEFFLAMSAGNGEACADHALAVAIERPDLVAEAGFRRDVTTLVKRSAGRTAGQFSLAAFAAELFAIQRRYRAYSRASFIFPLAALLAIEGQVKQLDPEINFQALTGPIVLRGLVERTRARKESGTGIASQSESNAHLNPRGGQ